MPQKPPVLNTQKYQPPSKVQPRVDHKTIETEEMHFNAESDEEELPKYNKKKVERVENRQVAK